MHRIQHRLISFLLAAAVSVSSLCTSAFAEEIAVNEEIQQAIPCCDGTEDSEAKIGLEETLLDMEKADFFYLAQFSLEIYAKQSVGDTRYELTETALQLLDNNYDEKLTMDDSFQFLSWYASQSSGLKNTQEMEDYLSIWNFVHSDSVTVATPITTQLATEEATTTTIATTPFTVNVITTTTEATTTTTTMTTTTTTTTTTKATTTTTTTAKSVYNGVDVSKWQGTVDWTKVKAAGKDFAIIRAGYGKELDQEDPTFDTNVKNAKAAGLSVGAYWFSYATTVADAKKEAEVFYQVVKGYTFEYPLVLDMETTAQANLSKEVVSAMIEAFCTVLEDKGYYVSLYSYATFLSTKVYQSTLEDYDIWVANFTTNSKPSYTATSYGMWQWSSTGTVNGISGSVDLDRAYKNYPALMKKYGLNGF